MKFVQSWLSIMAKLHIQHVALHEKIYASLALFIAILVLVKVVNFAAFGGAFSLLVLGSIGASAFLLFVIPYSPMSQPWAVISGHFVSSVIGAACAYWISSPATATVVALSIYAMHSLQCLHPPGATPPLPGWCWVWAGCYWQVLSATRGICHLRQVRWCLADFVAGIFCSLPPHDSFFLGQCHWRL